LTTSTPTTRPAYVLDTHALIWYLTKPKNLGKQASRLFASAENGETQLIISAIVVAELFYANAKWQLFEDFVEQLTELQQKPYFQFVDFRTQDVRAFDAVSAVPEMHDRIITGLAKRLGVPIITSDPLIKAAKVVEVVW